MLTLWKPFNELSRWNNEWQDFLGTTSRNGQQFHFSPSVDIQEAANEVLIQADLPGVSEKDIDVQVEDGVLLLSGNKKVSKDEKNEGYTYREGSYGSVHRQFNLGTKIDVEKIKAQYTNGVLTLTLPKKEEIKPKQIEIKTN